MRQKILGEVKGVYNKITYVEMIASALWVIVGIILTSKTGGSATIFSVLTGILFIISGISSMFAYLKRGTISLFNLNILFGVLLIVMGGLAFVLANHLQIILGIGLVILGIQKGFYGLVLKKFAESSWLITLVVGILFVVMGGISFFSDNITEVCGIFLLGYGLINIISVILLRKRSKYYIA